MKIDKNTSTFELTNYLWNSDPNDTKVSLSLRVEDFNLYFSFHVTEKELRRMVKEDNGSVWEDSCVELFISPDKVHYYNFEFSASTALRGGYGSSRSDRTPVDTDLLKLVKRNMKIFENNNKRSTYELSGVIPLKSFSLDRDKLYINAYKCGDKLSKPHFISLFPIDTPAPDFHQIRFFQEIELIN